MRNETKYDLKLSFWGTELVKQGHESTPKDT